MISLVLFFWDLVLGGWVVEEGWQAVLGHSVEILQAAAEGVGNVRGSGSQGGSAHDPVVQAVFGGWRGEVLSGHDSSGSWRFPYAVTAGLGHVLCVQRLLVYVVQDHARPVVVMIFGLHGEEVAVGIRESLRVDGDGDILSSSGWSQTGSLKLNTMILKNIEAVPTSDQIILCNRYSIASIEDFVHKIRIKG